MQIKQKCLKQKRRPEYDVVPARKTVWFPLKTLRIALDRGWFLQFRHIIIKTHRAKSDNGKWQQNLWAVYDENV